MNEEEEDELRMQNEIEKLKMQAEFGAKFMEGNSKIPPEIEAAFLNSIRNFEENYDKAPRRILNEILEYPIFKPVSEIAEDNMETELENVMELLHKKHFHIDADEEVPAKELYRFIIEELINEEVDFFDLPGGFTCFIYEEFYPNHAKDIIRRVEEFFEQMFEKEMKWLDMSLEKTIELGNGKTYTIREFIDGCMHFIDAYREFEVVRLEFEKPEFNEDGGKGTVIIDIEYDCIIEDGTKNTFSGRGKFDLVLSPNEAWWTIAKMDFPGLRDWIR